jgi:pyruvate,water dikinase
MRSIVWLDEPAATSPDLVGPKAAALARMTRAGLAVPRGFCLTVNATSRQLHAAGLDGPVGRLVEAAASDLEWRRAAAMLWSALASTDLEPEVAAELRVAYTELQLDGAQFVAARSSALIEDRPGASFAGQFTSFLGVAGFDELSAAVRACWASRWSDRVIAYARSREVDPGQAGMAVIVQAMIPAESAGSALSADPTSGQQDVIVVNGAWGLGRAVAEGEVVPDFWRLERAGPTIRERRPGHKPLADFLGPGGGEVWQRQPPERAAAPCLRDDALLGLGHLVARVEDLFGAPQEVEWAFAADRLWLLQARPLAMPGGRPASPSSPSWTGPAVEGQPTSGGRVVGRARVVKRPEDVALVQPGEILVTTFMRPTMTPLLSFVGGLVVEAGGSTAHTANLARERRIPAIMGALGATRVIPDGSLVLVDGTAGRARLMKDEGLANK